jgi:hypothetical protein
MLRTGRMAYREEKNCGAFYTAQMCLEMFSYTPSGRMTSKELALYASGFINLPMAASFTYDNEGRTTSITYPSGATNTGTGPYSYTFDALGRPTGLGSYASGATYNAANQLTQITYAPGTETRTYNTLNQLTNLQAGAGVNLNYVYNAGTNNGQMAQTIEAAHGQSVMYTYDSLKRVSTAKASAIPYILNQGFELTTMSPWTVASSNAVEGVNYLITDVSPQSGTYSLTTNSAIITQTATCYAGATYTLSGYYKAPFSFSPVVSVSLGGGGGTDLTFPESTWTAFSKNFTIRTNALRTAQRAGRWLGSLSLCWRTLRFSQCSLRLRFRHLAKCTLGCGRKRYQYGGSNRRGRMGIDPETFKQAR